MSFCQNNDLTKADFDEKVFIKLSTLFAQNPEKAILKTQNYLQKPKFSTYEQYLEDVNSTQSLKSCNTSWKESTLCAKCIDCCLTDDSTFCMQCYLSGNHDQHRSYLIVSKQPGKCGCGNPYLIKSSGFCQKHPGSDSRPDVDQMTPENRKKFITVFKAAYFGALNSNNEQNCIYSLEWISKFISIGDGYRRCASIAITSSGDSFFYSSLIKLTEKSTDCLLNLFEQLTYDVHFNLQMGLSSIVNYLNLKNSLKKNSFVSHPVQKYLHFCWNFFNERTIRYTVNTGIFNWVEFVIQSFDFEINTLFEPSWGPKTNKGFSNLFNFVQTMLKMDDQHSNIQKFLKVYGMFLSKIERSFHFYISELNDDNLDDQGVDYQILLFFMKMNSLFSSHNQNLSSKNKIFEIGDIISILFDYLKKQRDMVTETIFSINSEQSLSVDLYLHHLLFCLLSNYSNPGKVVEKECKKQKINFQEFCVLSTIFPLRILVAFFCCDRLTITNEDALLIFQFLFEKSELLIAPLFGLIQLILEMAPNKEQILRNIVEIFGGFSTYSLKDSLSVLKKLPEASKNSVFNAAMFIICVLIDRSILNEDKYCFKRMLIVELLMKKKATFDMIEYIINEKLTNTVLEDYLRDYIERVEINRESLYKLKDESISSPFFPVIEYPERIKYLMKYKDNLISVENDSISTKNKLLEVCYRTPTFLSLIYLCLTSSEKKLIEVQIGLLMFILSAQNGPKFDDESYKSQDKITIKGKNLSEIINEFEKNVKSNDNCFMVNFKYKNKECSILQLVQDKEQLGIKALTKAELPQFLLPEVADKTSNEKQKKEKAEKMKESIMNEFKNRMNNFPVEEGNKTGIIRQQSSSLLACCICENDSTEEDVFVFPCLAIQCNLVPIFENKFHKNSSIEKLNPQYSITICNHPIHMNCCIDQITKYLMEHDDGLEIYKCGIDKGIRNSFVPLFQPPPFKEGDVDDFKIEISSTMKKAIDECIHRTFRYETDVSNRLLAESYAGIVATLEVRHRSRPECFDSPTVPVLLRNYLLTLYHYIHPKLKKKKEKKDFNNPTLLLVYSIMEMNSTSEYIQCVQKIAQKLNSEYLFEFLRRAAIIDDIALKALNGKSTKFIDWDEILSFESLIKRFDLHLKNSKPFELPLFETIHLPKNFFDLYKKPYNYDIVDYSVEKCVDLLTGQVVVLNENQKTKNLPFIDEYNVSMYCGGIAMFLCLTGPKSTAVLYYSKQKSLKIIQGSFYLDKFGDSDTGFKRGVSLTLSEGKLNMALDQLLSGEIPLKY